MSTEDYIVETQHVKRFFGKVVKTDSCWLWLATTRCGKGEFFVGNKRISAEQYSWFYHHGSIPDGKFVLWSCGNRLCVNPSHLYLGNERDKERERFFGYVNKTETCWEWTGALWFGYGIFWTAGGRNDGRKVQAHRFSWELHAGEIPEEMNVLHHCDNRRCVRPDHLFLGTHDDNMKDKVAKGRSACAANGNHGTITKPHRIARGTRNGNAKLTDDDIRSIRENYGKSGNSSYVLADRYGVSKTMILNIVNNKVWRHISGERNST